MNAPRPSGPLRANGRVSNGIVIREGVRPPSRQCLVEGKGKNVMVVDMVGEKNMDLKRNTGGNLADGSGRCCCRKFCHGSKKCSETVEAVGVKVPEIHSTNRFTALIDSNEEGDVGNHEGIDNSIDRGMDLVNPDVKLAVFQNTDGLSAVRKPPVNMASEIIASSLFLAILIVDNLYHWLRPIFVPTMFRPLRRRYSYRRLTGGLYTEGYSGWREFEEPPASVDTPPLLHLRLPGGQCRRSDQWTTPTVFHWLTAG
ncbi:hypothetical protein MA16_Dca017665 [Dendrobium catenatum]|uniref:Uncharacterized protein n=1 Tax=Dendrobium catenatum TaxID=906689 RepID=A0A2I0XA90_9ASPA|nr:hypothetical protein MA16_Dca017665 [Dendrobium catenatum]